MPQILCFGDSIVQGFYDPKGGWVGRLNRASMEKTLADDNFYCPVFNLGISGDRSEYLLERFHRETEVRIKEEDKTIFIFSCGSNDSIFLLQQKKHQTPLTDFSANLQKLLGEAKKHPGQVLWVGEPPIDESLTDPIPWYPEGSYCNEFIEKYSQATQKVCQEYSVPYLDLFSVLMNDEKWNSLLFDGIHPNSAGHELMFDKILPFIQTECNLNLVS